MDGEMGHGTVPYHIAITSYFKMLRKMFPIFQPMWYVIAYISHKINILNGYLWVLHLKKQCLVLIFFAQHHQIAREKKEEKNTLHSKAKHKAITFLYNIREFRHPHMIAYRFATCFIRI